MKLGKLIKRFFLLIVFLILLIFGAAIAIPYFYKDEIVEWARTDLNKSLDATLDFSDVNLSLIQSFPDLLIQLEGLTVDGKGAYEGIRLVEAEDIGLEVDIMSVIKEELPIEIHQVFLTDPKLHLIIPKSGKPNYDIALASDTEATTDTEASYDFLIQLERYAITNGDITFDDQAGDVYVEVKGLTHEGSGDFTQNAFDVDTDTEIQSMSVKSGGVKYLSKAKGDLDAIIAANLPEMTFTLKDNSLKVNALTLNADGFVKINEDGSYGMDLKFDAPKNTFKEFLSLIPNAYTKDFSDVKADGKLAFSGSVKGTYDGVKEQYPPFNLNLGVENGSVQYPDLPMGITNVFTNVKINSPSSNLDRMTIDIPKLNLKIGDHPVESSLTLKTPLSDPDIDTKIKGLIDLAEFSKAFPMEGVSEMTGTIDADVAIKARMSEVEKEQYEQVNMEGNVAIKDLVYAAEDLPKVLISQMQADFSPKQVLINQFEAKLGKSDLSAKGSIDNILAYISPEKTMTGTLSARSNYFDANEWISEEEAAPTPEIGEPVEVFDRFVFDLDAYAKKVDYLTYQLDDLKAKGKVTPERADLSSFSTSIGESDFSGNGEFNNLFDYVYANEELTGTINLNSNYINVNQFMEEVPEGATAKPIADTEELEPFLVPPNMDITVNAKVNKALYTNIDMKRATGKIRIKDEAMFFEDIVASTMGGKMNLAGSYNTKGTDEPEFHMKYNVQDFRFKEAFEKFNTFQMLAPVGNYINGKFNSTLVFDGILGKDMFPKFSSISADGFLQTLDAVIENFEPLKAVGDKLNLDVFKNVKLTNTKNFFTVENGFVVLAPTEHKIKGIDMVIGGRHSLEQKMDYDIEAKIPRKLLGKNAVGQAANTGLNFLSKEASKLGLNIDAGEFVNVVINLTGDIKNPKVKLRLAGTEGSASDAAGDLAKQTAKMVADSLKQVAQDKLDAEKAKAEAYAQAKADSLKAVAQEKVDKEIEKGKEVIKDKVNEEVTKQEEEVVGDKADEAVDKILNNEEVKNKVEDKLKDFKIDGLFGKKKKKKDG